MDGAANMFRCNKACAFLLQEEAPLAVNHYCKLVNYIKLTTMPRAILIMLAWSA